MSDIALWGTFEVLSGEDQEAENIFAETSKTIAAESGTTGFYAVKIEPGKYETFRVYADEAVLDVHQAGSAGKDAVTLAVGATLAAAPEMTRSVVFHGKAPDAGS